MLPELPTNDSVYAQSIRSVERRGFHNTPSSLFHDPLLMAQYARLNEEMNEYLAAIDNDWPRHLILSEAADVVIVAHQMFWLLDGGDFLALNIIYNARKSLVECREYIDRSLRGDSIDKCRYAIVLLIEEMYCRVDRVRTGKLDEMIVYKLAADEKRGYQHNGVKETVS